MAIQKIYPTFPNGTGPNDIEVSQRGSTEPVTKKVKPLPHLPFKEDPKGCGNPICVVLDQKPRRFPSLCQFRKWLLDTSRDCQINYIQKGDCYEIIDGDGQKNEKQPWTEPLPDSTYDNDICEGCRNDTNCKKKVTFNIDLQNLLEGQSSAKGGPTYQNDDDDEEGVRMVGVPVEFDNICEAMRYFSKRDNLNINTQVIGFGHKKKDDLLPLQGDKCLWTEWFDLESPCQKNGELEKFQEAKNMMMEQESGPLRICEAESVMKTEYAGGSELNTVDSNLAKLGQAIGNGGISFKQNIDEITEYKLRCWNSQNMEMNQTVPAPYAYPPDKNTTCLDYKARYCCKSIDIYRPTDIEDFSEYLHYIFPIGATKIDLDASDERITKATMTILSCVGAKTTTEAKIIFEYADKSKNKDKGKVIIELKKGQGANTKIVEMEGSFKIERRNETRHKIYTIDYDSGKIVLKIKLGKNEAGKIDPVVENCEIHSKDTTTIAKVKFYPGDTATPTQPQQPISKPSQTWTTTITSDGKENYEVKIDNKMNVLSQKGPTPTYLDKVTDMWKKISQLNAELNFDYFIESPPLAVLFAECDWKDYINENYPNKDGKSENYEFELKETAYKNQAFKKHVCENSRTNSHFIDAVTVEDQIPWYEVKLTNGEQHETLKLTPYYGYACYDENQAGDGGLCQDMKVRYCCAKQHRSSWGEWGAWAACDKTCGGGKQTRTRRCVRSADVDEQSSPCFGQDSNEADYYSQQKKECNVAGCPTDYKFDGWCAWTQCSESCGKGYKTRDRQCFDGENGGEECPAIFDKAKNRKSTEYEQREFCTTADCIVPQWSHWSAWSSCSVSCGKGLEQRTRGCRTSRTFAKLPLDFCGSPQHAKDKRDCKSTECAIDGNWGKWTAWSACNQNCIYDVNSDDVEAEQYNSKAHRKRYRYCVAPIPEFGGKGCVTGTGRKLRDAPEIQKKNCSVEEEPSLNYCAENCVYSSWTEWSECSQTCATADFEFLKDDDNNDINEINPKVTQNVLPQRSRVRKLLKLEKHGGSCHRSSHFIEDKTKTGLGFDYEQVSCPCCKYTDRHGEERKHDEGEVFRENKLIPYDENKDCIPMCPYSCEWGTWTSQYDCENPGNVMRKMRTYGWTFNETRNCYDVPIAEKFETMSPEQWETFLDSVYNTENWIIEDTIDPSFRDLPRKVRGDLLTIRRAWDGFIYVYGELTSKKIRRTPRGIIIDPVFGGTNCYALDVLKIFNYTLTRISNTDPQAEGWNRGKIKNKIHEHFEEKEKPGVCTFPICPPKFEQNPNNIVQTCGRYMWTRWGEWGQCNLQCGPKGQRTRKRKCTECGDPKGEHNPSPAKEGDCKPTLTFDGSEGLTDTDTTRCSPCPSESLAGWAHWEEWSAPDQTECGSKANQYRVRKCNDDYKAALEAEGDKKTCAGVQRESRTLKNSHC